MASRILITGGAGFIGSHLADELLALGHHVRVLDDLNPQVHGPDRRRPPYLAKDAELVVGDVRDRDVVSRALHGVDAVYHFAARVGVGQSMYAAAEYTSVNTLGTAVVLEAAVQARVGRLVVASSMSVYGEGLYRDARGATVESARRSIEQLRAGDWEVRGADGGRLLPIATPETKPPALESIYALNKYDQERSSLIMGRAYGIDVVALRFFNTYGPRQALSNPYTGVLAIFASRLLNDNPPLVFEDGHQKRDFVSVHDVVRACVLALSSRGAVGRVLNVASGRPRTVREVAEGVAAAVGRPGLAPEIAGSCRVGDVRHCFADISLARDVLGYEPLVDFDDGVRELAGWLQGQVARDRMAEARAELEARGLTL
ncbi:MAG TPA: NAD-dependent epimerase/dehydratase family protein [Polyangiaceae bacterium]|nr:NAD-dependent epimerase/dehydratase family protein [Polyangiaceae bacterium]